jgi:hypothetical protein
MRTLFITYYTICLLSPVFAYETHVCKESHQTTPMHVLLFSVEQQRMFYKDIQENE